MLWTFYRLDRSDKWPCLAPAYSEDTEYPMERVKELKLHAFGDPKHKAFFPAPRPSSHNTPPFRREVNRILRDPVVGVDGCIRARVDSKNRRLSRAGRPSDTSRTMALVGLHKAASDDTTRLPEDQRMRRGVMPWCGMDMADAGGMTPAERSIRLEWWQTLTPEKQAALQATALDPSVPYEGPLGGVLNRVQPVQPQSDIRPVQPSTPPADTTPSVPQPQPHNDPHVAALLAKLQLPGGDAPASEVPINKDWPSVREDAVVWCGLPADEARAMSVHARRDRYWWWCNLPLEERQSLNAQARAAAEQGQI